MNPATLTAILSLVQMALPLIQTSGAAGNVITVLTEAVPLAIKVGGELKPIAANIIGALKANGAITQAQWDALDAMEKQIDADFDAAAAAAQAEDRA